MENIRGKILWIDDEIQHLKPHIMYLESKGYNIDSTNNGNDGVILAKKNKYDIVLLDQNMPGMDGLSTLKELKINNSLVTIIMITKTEDEWLMDEAIIEKVEQFLIKRGSCEFLVRPVCIKTSLSLQKNAIVDRTFYHLRFLTALKVW